MKIRLTLLKFKKIVTLKIIVKAQSLIYQIKVLNGIKQRSSMFFSQVYKVQTILNSPTNRVRKKNHDYVLNVKMLIYF